MTTSLSKVMIGKGQSAKLSGQAPIFISCFEEDGEYGSNFVVTNGQIKNSNDGDLSCAYQEKQPGDLQIDLKAKQKTIIKQLKGEIHPLISCFRKSDGEFTTSLNYDLKTGEVQSYDSDVSCLIRVPKSQEVLTTRVGATSEKVESSKPH